MRSFLANAVENLKQLGYVVLYFSIVIIGGLAALGGPLIVEDWGTHRVEDERPWEQDVPAGYTQEEWDEATGTVFVTRHGDCYHRRNCPALYGHGRPVLLEQVEDDLSACRRCDP